jgi:hypothetical protein
MPIYIPHFSFSLQKIATYTSFALALQILRCSPRMTSRQDPSSIKDIHRPLNLLSLATRILHFSLFLYFLRIQINTTWCSDVIKEWSHDGASRSYELANINSQYYFTSMDFFSVSFVRIFSLFWKKEACEITLLSVCVSVCASPSLCESPLRFRKSPCSLCASHFFVFYEVRVV